ncbi:40S ribosomal protein S14 [Biomphalaria glabrata]|nr:40S ribosomal protein S14 [Biomphalaria glabrata]
MLVFNATFVHVTDVSGKETVARVTGGMIVMKLHLMLPCWLLRMLQKAAKDRVLQHCILNLELLVETEVKHLGLEHQSALRATGGNRSETPGPGATVST